MRYQFGLEMFNKNECHINVIIYRVIPMAEIYVFSQLVYVNFASINVLSGDGKILLTGCGNAVVKKEGAGDVWQIQEALWNIFSP